MTPELVKLLPFFEVILSSSSQRPALSELATLSPSQGGTIGSTVLGSETQLTYSILRDFILQPATIRI